MSTSITYGTLAELKDRLDIESTETTHDQILGAVLEAASRAIDGICGWRFYTTTSDETRYYTGEWGDQFFCDDPIVSITTLKTDDDGDRTYDETWTTDDYDPMPYNAATDNRPYTWLEVTPNGDYTFPTSRKGIQIVGKFGWPELPSAIKDATLLLAEKIFSRKDAIFGVMGSPELGTLREIVKNDPELMILLAPYKRLL